MTTTILPDEVNTLPIFGLLGDDEPRARRSDPVTSHAAADKSAHGLSEMKVNILNIFERFGALTDSELNDIYQRQSLMFGWKKVRPDTPRKRRSDLSSAGFLVDTGETRVNQFGSAEVVWGLKK